MPSPNQVKAQTQQRFGQFAQEYVESKNHAAGADLKRLVELASPQAHWIVLDVATGGGHTTLKFAPHVRKVFTCDLTPKMLQAARTFIGQQGVSNIIYATADAEQLPFPPDLFDLVTCRIAPHHFPNCFRFVQECARVLKPGGRLLVEDHLLPDDERAARYIDSFERLRDPSHHRAFAAYEWQGMLMDAGLSVQAVEPIVKTGIRLVEWAAQQGNTPEVIERLQILLAQAPAAVADVLNPRCVGTADATFDHPYILIMGQKP